MKSKHRLNLDTKLTEGKETFLIEIKTLHCLSNNTATSNSKSTGISDLIYNQRLQ